MEEYPIIPIATNLMKKVKTTRRLKGKLPQENYIPNRIVIYRTYAAGHIPLQKIYINCQMYYHMLRKVTARNNS